MRRVVFVGNHDVNFSTESHHCWTFERLGWQVTKIQENKTNSEQILSTCKNANLLSWTHTHGWDFPGCSLELINRIRDLKVPSYSYHLDKYFGIPARENSYLQHSSFHLDYFFSTDGGNEQGWKDAGINHVYLPPGCVEYGCHYGVKHGDIPVLFAGSVNYHGEYPFRPRMAEALRIAYGDRFQIRTGVREEALNDLYASARVCVGDHIFAGCPLYVSDRLFETIGRGGFIIYPNTPGVTDLIPGLVVYEPQNISDLICKIDYFLDSAHEAERVERRDAAHEWAKKNATYTRRLASILQTMGLA